MGLLSLLRRLSELIEVDLREDRGVGKGLERTAHDEGQRGRQLHEEDGLVCPAEQGDCIQEMMNVRYSIRKQSKNRS